MILRSFALSTFFIVCTFGLALRVKDQPNDPCRTCQMIMNIAIHHFHSTPTKSELKSALIEECKDISHNEGPVAGKQCMDLVNNNFDLIYEDLEVKDKNPQQTCEDLGQC